MSQNPRQSKSIRAQLLTAMQVGEYAHCDRLPRESVLSEMLGISRTQLRDILASLDREGFITPSWSRHHYQPSCAGCTGQNGH